VPIIGKFEGNGISVVFLRAEKAAVLHTQVDPTARDIIVRGVPAGGSLGYHPSDPNWKPTPPESWGLAFSGKRYSDRLIISTKNEIKYMHHHYFVDALEIVVPGSVRVVPVARTLTADGAPDLTAPP